MACVARDLDLVTSGRAEVIALCLRVVRCGNQVVKQRSQWATRDQRRSRAIGGRRMVECKYPLTWG